MGGVDDQTAFNGVAVDVLQLLDTLSCGEDVEVVISRLPQGAVCLLDGNGEFQGLQSFGQNGLAWFGE